MNAALASTVTAERFVLRLASAAPVGELQAWLTDARSGDRVEYASGIDLPREAEGVVLVKRWISEGLVTVFSQRDPADNRRWLYIAERISRPPHGALRDRNESAVSSAPSRSATPLRPDGATGRTSRYHLADHCAGEAIAASSSGAVGRTKYQADALLRLLRGRAAAGKPCPSFAETAALLGLKGTRRVRYLFDKLATDGRIAVTWAGPGKGRVVTILAGGRAQGKSTA